MWGHNWGHVRKSNRKIINKFNIIIYQMRFPVIFRQNSSVAARIHLSVNTKSHCSYCWFRKLPQKMHTFLNRIL